MTNSELAILSLVAEQARYGYEIEQVIESRDMRDWTEIGFSSIYYLLTKLEKKGLIDGSFVQSPGKGPPKKIYKLTEKGEIFWKKSVIEVLSVPKQHSSSFLIGLSNLPAMDRDEVYEACSNYLENLKTIAATLMQKTASKETMPDHVNTMFSYSLKLIKSEAEWVEGFARKFAPEG